MPDFFLVNTFSSQSKVLIWTAVLASGGGLISSLELLAGRREFREDGLFAWEVLRSVGMTADDGRLSRLLASLLRYPNVLVVFGLRAVAFASVGILALTRPPGPAFVGALGLAFFTGLLFQFRTPYGLDGSDQVSMVVIAALFIQAVVSESVLVAHAAIWFIALQACLSYFTSGVAKLVSPVWRDGTGLVGVMKTRDYGRPVLGQLLATHPSLAWLAAWGVILPEILFPTVLFLGFPIAFAFLLWGFIFHLMAALIMGLNGFVWSFLATYPALVHVILTLNP